MLKGVGTGESYICKKILVANHKLSHYKSVGKNKRR